MSTANAYNKIYNYNKIYKNLHEQYGDVINFNNPKLLADDAHHQVFHFFNHSLPLNLCLRWVREYMYRANLKNLYMLGNNKYNLDGSISSKLTQSDIDKTIQEARDFGPFSDPMTDFGFKHLFANDTNLSPLRNLLNALLEFQDDDKIIDLVLNKHAVTMQSEYGINSAVDIRCTLANGQKITVEMQRKYADYFLARSQYYMAESVVQQCQSGISSDYHKVIQDTYVISIGRENFFKEQHNLKCPSQYKHIIKPMIVARNSDGQEVGVQIAPENKLTWCYFELQKFKHQYYNGEVSSINKDSPIQAQWLDFLWRCGKTSEIPKDISEEIKEAYNIMEVYKFTPSEALAYTTARLNCQLQENYEAELTRKAEEAEKQRIEAEKQRIEAEKRRIEAEHKAEKRRIEAEKRIEEIQEATRTQLVQQKATTIQNCLKAKLDDATVKNISQINQEQLDEIKSLSHPPSQDSITAILLKKIKHFESMTISNFKACEFVIPLTLKWDR